MVWSLIILLVTLVLVLTGASWITVKSSGRRGIRNLKASVDELTRDETMTDDERIRVRAALQGLEAVEHVPWLMVIPVDTDEILAGVEQSIAAVWISRYESPPRILVKVEIPWWQGWRLWDSAVNQ